MAHRSWAVRWLAAVFVGLACHACVAATVVLLPPLESESDTRGYYPRALLQLILAKSGGDYEVRNATTTMGQARSMALLERAQGIDVVVTMTSIEREQHLLPIRIPIDKGLIGWRLLLIRPQDRHQFDTITLDGLRRLSAGQGHDWPDAPILRANGLKVMTNPNYDALFQQLLARRFDYFPRAVTEVVDEQHRYPGLMIEPRLALHYPAAEYFFVNRNNAALAADIERGFRVAIQDGSFDKLFQATFGEAMREVDLSHRSTLELHNPFLPPETPLQDATLWYKPVR